MHGQVATGVATSTARRRRSIWTASAKRNNPFFTKDEAPSPTRVVVAVPTTTALVAPTTTKATARRSLARQRHVALQNQNGVRQSRTVVQRNRGGTQGRRNRTVVRRSQGENRGRQNLD